jgi:hypothetical protein
LQNHHPESISTSYKKIVQQIFFTVDPFRP